MYTSLRQNIITTVYNSWLTTGFAWEQYNPSTGTGQRTQGFTGWTALVVNILAMPDLTNAHTNPTNLNPSSNENLIVGSYQAPISRPSPVPRTEYGSILFFVFIVVLMSAAVFSLKSCWMKQFGRPGFTGVVRVERPNQHLYVRLNHIRSFMPPGF
jgi:hypothetical protein